MKVGILTFHRAYNYGAFLQCYSLQKKIKDTFPEWDVSVIDYMSKNMYEYYNINIKNYIFNPYNSINNNSWNHYAYNFIRNFYAVLKGCRKYKQYVAQKEIYKKFDELYCELALTKERLISDDYNKIEKFIEDLNYDIIVVGSDAIWNDYQTNIPNIFYLSKNISAKKFSYAASNYGMAYGERNSVNCKYIVDALSDFQFIGVRDEETERYLNKLSDKFVCNHTCDPSLLLDLDCLKADMKEIEEKLRKQGIDINKPMVGVMGSDKIGKIVRMVCGDVQIVSVYGKNMDSDAELLSLNQFEWAKIFSYFTVTFTSFFHGTIFSLKNGTPTITIEQNVKYADKYKTKTRDLLERLSLSDYYFGAERQEIEFIKKQYNYILENPQEERIFKALSDEAKSAELFFEALKDVQEYGGK